MYTFIWFLLLKLYFCELFLQIFFSLQMLLFLSKPTKTRSLCFQFQCWRIQIETKPLRFKCFSKLESCDFFPSKLAKNVFVFIANNDVNFIRSFNWNNCCGMNCFIMQTIDVWHNGEGAKNYICFINLFVIIFCFSKIIKSVRN